MLESAPFGERRRVLHAVCARTFQTCQRGSVLSWIAYRGLVHAITVRDIRSRYAGSVFGALWLLLPPIVMVLIYTVIFSQIMRARLPGSAHPYAYSLYLCAGLIAWGLLLELVQRGKNIFIEHANLIRKAYFPRLILFIPVAVVALFNSMILLGLVLLFMLLSASPLQWGNLYLLPILFCCLFLGLAAGLLLAVVNVFFRDTGQIADVLFQGLFWATPIVYPVNILSERVQAVLHWNPMFAIVRQAQNALLGHPVTLAELWYPCLFACGLLALGSVLYRRSYADMLDQV